MSDLRIEGADKLALIGKAVRTIGTDRTIIKNLTKRVRKLGAPVRAELKASAIANLPRAGGLNLWVASSRITVQVRRGETTAGLDITAGRNSKRRRSDLRRLDQGTIRHPSWGDRRTWTAQSIEPGVFSNALDGPITDDFQVQVVGALDDTIAQVLHGF